MKLTNCLLFTLASADGPGDLSDITPFLNELGDYCVETFGLPAYRPKPNESRADWAKRWTARRDFILTSCESQLDLTKIISEF